MSSSANSPVNGVPFPFIAVGDLFTTGLADDQRTAWLPDHLKLQLSVGRTTFFCGTSLPQAGTRWFDQHFQTFHTLSAVD